MMDLPKAFDSQLHEARKKTERLINVRDRSSAELMSRLLHAGFSGDVALQEVQDALITGLIDDERFMRLYVESKKRSGWGQHRIEAELRRFGINIRLCEGYPESFFCENDEADRALGCLRRFNTKSKNWQAACFRRLISKGYSVETAKKVVKTCAAHDVEK